MKNTGNGDGAVLRAFAFHSYGPGLTSRPGLTCEVILSAVLVLVFVLVLVPAPWVFSRSSGFPSPIKTNILNFKSTGKQWSRRTTAKNPISHPHTHSHSLFPLSFSSSRILINLKYVYLEKRNSQFPVSY